MKRFILASASLIASCIALPLHAQTITVGAQYFAPKLDFDGHDASPKLYGVSLGIETIERLYFELHTTVNDKSDQLFGVDTEVRDSNAAYFRFASEQYDGVSLDILLGYARNTVTFSGRPEVYESKEEFNGFAWGLNLNYHLSDYILLTGGYQSRYSKDDIKLAGLSAGFIVQF
ncbi:outer membrane beta-barrel protein [Pseudoalteromonas fenneropenaei]|uniref:Outer membrane beta-barrel protein n=1 Tax=Pseudoalteromonas fenneropenaei TaxID=1737459 RepID=A0ABV7CK17_9GAMM